MTNSESKGRYFLQNESIQIDSHNESIRIANWNALLGSWSRCRHASSLAGQLANESNAPAGQVADNLVKSPTQ